MSNYMITQNQINNFTCYLKQHDISSGTIEKYHRDLKHMVKWLNKRKLSLELLVQWRDVLLSEGRCPATVNSMLAAVNTFFRYKKCKIHIPYLRVQRCLFRNPKRELTRQEYVHLVKTAKNIGKEKLALIIEMICATGIRVSEVSYITVEAAQSGKAQIFSKGKIRVILLPAKLCQKLLHYAKKHKIVSGEIFLTRNGKTISRKQIWAEMKRLCTQAHISPEKVFPHNLRHLFAQTFYRTTKDVVMLADILGHSNIETTRIYLISTGVEHMQLIERLSLLL